MHFKKLLTIFIIFILLGCSDSSLKYPLPDMSIKGQLEWQKKLYFERIAEFKKNPIGENKVVFLGNSITQGGGDWNKRYNSEVIVNRGVSGDFTNGVLQRLDEIIFYRPTSVFLMIGINEFFADNSSNPNINPKYVANNILKIANIIKEDRPKLRYSLAPYFPLTMNNILMLRMLIIIFFKKIFTLQLMIKL